MRLPVTRDVQRLLLGQGTSLAVHLLPAAVLAVSALLRSAPLLLPVPPPPPPPPPPSASGGPMTSQTFAVQLVHLPPRAPDARGEPTAQVVPSPPPPLPVSQPKPSATPAQARNAPRVHEDGHRPVRSPEQARAKVPAAVPERPKPVASPVEPVREERKAHAHHLELPPGGNLASSVAGAAGDPGEVDGPADPLDAVVRARVLHVASLLASSAAQRARREGQSTVRFLVDAKGYVERVQLLRSAGHRLLDQEVEAILHLAEPFPGERRREHELSIPFALPESFHARARPPSG